MSQVQKICTLKCSYSVVCGSIKLLKNGNSNIMQFIEFILRQHLLLITCDNSPQQFLIFCTRQQLFVLSEAVKELKIEVKITKRSFHHDELRKALMYQIAVQNALIYDNNELYVPALKKNNDTIQNLKNHLLVDVKVSPEQNGNNFQIMEININKLKQRPDSILLSAKQSLYEQISSNYYNQSQLLSDSQNIKQSDSKREYTFTTLSMEKKELIVNGFQEYCSLHKIDILFQKIKQESQNKIPIKPEEVNDRKEATQEKITNTIHQQETNIIYPGKKKVISFSTSVQILGTNETQKLNDCQKSVRYFVTEKQILDVGRGKCESILLDFIEGLKIALQKRQQQ